MEKVLKKYMIVILFFCLLLSSAAILYTAAQNARSVRTLATQALESTALALSSSAESSLRMSGKKADDEMREIFSDRVVAYALITGKDGKILFHTNSGLVGSNLREEGLSQWLQSGKPSGRRITLQTGIPAYEFNYIIHRSNGSPEMLRLVLNTAPADRIVSQARRMWWLVGIILLFLWTVGILFVRMSLRHIHLQEELEQRKRMALIGQMTAVLTHEIRNALGSVKGYTQWVNEKIAESDPRKAGLSMVLKGTDRIESLVNELLLFSREETYNIYPLNLPYLIEEAILSFVPPWKGKVELDIEPETKVMADKEKLHQVLLNGIQNAIQAMGNDGKLFISSHHKGHWVEMKIEDSGPGIPKSELSQLFTPFYTTKTNGTGLGLAYSKKVIERMGGRITLSGRQEGAGAVLTILLKKGKP